MASTSSIENILRVPVFDTVKWIESTRPASFLTSKYTEARRHNFLMILLEPVELILLSMILFIHRLPWPESILKVLYRIDAFVVSVLEDIIHAIEKIWNYFTSTFTKLKQLVENVIDFFLSLTIFVIMKIGMLYAIVFDFLTRISRVAFFPWLQLAEYVISQYKQRENISAPPQLKTENTQDQASRNEPSRSLGSHLSVPAVNRMLQQSVAAANTESECDSDHSTVSDCNMQRHADQQGRLYKRIDVTVAPEGRLREELFRHVKGQLKVMRKNSVKLSIDLMSQIKQVLKPRLILLQKRLYKLAEDYNFVSAYLFVMKEIKSRPYISQSLEYSIAFLTSIISDLTSYVYPAEKKSRKTRSSRSESLRRRMASAKVPSPLATSPSGLLHSTEPSKPSENCFTPLTPPVEIHHPEDVKKDSKREDDYESNGGSNADSALASSIDDLNTASDDPATNTKLANKGKMEQKLSVDETAENIVQSNNMKNLEDTESGKESAGEKKSKKNVRYRV